MRILKDEKGMVTIYLVIIFMAMMVFIGLFIDLARIKVAQNQLRRVANASARSVLADYNTDLKNSFGLFTVNQNVQYQNEFDKYLKANLSVSEGQNYTLLDYKDVKGNINVIAPLTDNRVLKRQMLEDVKYSGPIELGRFTAKLLPLYKIFQFFDSQNEKRKVQERIDEKVEEFRDNCDETHKLRMDWIKVQQEQLSLFDRKTSLETQLRDSNLTEDQKAKIKADLSSVDMEIQYKEAQRIQAEKKLEEVKAKYRQIMTDIDAAEAELNSLENNEVFKEELPGDSAVTGETQDKISQAQQTLDSAEAQTDSTIDTIRQTGDKVTSLLDSGDIDNAARIALEGSNSLREKQDSKVEKSSEESNLENEANRYKAQLSPEVREAIDGKASANTVDRGTGEIEEKNGSKIEMIYQQMEHIGKLIKDLLAGVADHLFINEYVIKRFSNFTSKNEANNIHPDSEVEYIIFGGSAPKVAAVAEIWVIRFACDTAAYMAFNTVMPELLSRIIYSLAMGAIHATVDTSILLRGEEVPVANMWPSANNPLSGTSVNYVDHLRLMLATHFITEETKFNRIREMVQERSGVSAADARTMLSGDVTVSIRMWFIPLMGIDTVRGPFGTRLQNGRCYITKQVEFAY